MGKRRSARESALKALFQVDVGKLPLEEAVANIRLLDDDDPEVREFAEVLVRGAEAERELLDDIISRYASGWALDRMANVDRNLLRLALYELVFLEDIPPSVSINEAVDLGKLYSTADSGRFINGILGNFVRQGEAASVLAAWEAARKEQPAQDQEASEEEVTVESSSAEGVAAVEAERVSADAPAEHEILARLPTRPPPTHAPISRSEVAATIPIATKEETMSAQIIDGKAIAEEVRRQAAETVKALTDAGNPPPGLATVIVGEDPASQVYVRMKQKACEELGIDSFGHQLPATVSQDELEGLVRDLNADDRVNGILVQLPLPAGLDEEGVLNTVALEKDVDGFHPLNIGRLAQKGRDPLFVPCTPGGVLVLLEKAGATLEGANAVVLGRSNIVGMPMALLLVRENATVTICHSRTKDLPGVVREADILIVAVGRPEMVRGDWVKPGAIVIDVGINRVDDPDTPKGYRLVGDVAYDEVSEVAGAITPVPGGVGPLTIAMLMRATVQAAQRAAG